MESKNDQENVVHLNLNLKKAFLLDIPYNKNLDRIDILFFLKDVSMPVADMDFPKGAPAPQRGATTYHLANFCQKVHENERI